MKTRILFVCLGNICRSKISVTAPLLQRLPFAVASTDSAGNVSYKFATFFVSFLLLALLSVLSLAACGTADDNKDDYVKGTSAGKELGQTVAADDIFTLNCNKGYSMNPLIATNTNNQLVC